MTKDDIIKLDNPARENFDEKTWAAISYARDWALHQGNVTNSEVIGDFEKRCSAEERDTILAVIKIMDFVNRFNNTWFKPLERPL